MGKYKITAISGPQNSVEVTQVKVLNSIANELAEANRLKRLELSLSQKRPYNEDSVPMNVVFSIKELENKA